MNNSKIALENLVTEEDNRLSFLQKQKGELSILIEVINRVQANEDWQKLRRILLDGVVPGLEKELQAHSERKELNVAEIYRTQGRLEAARKYLDLEKMVTWKKKELENINNLIKNEYPRHGGL